MRSPSFAAKIAEYESTALVYPGLKPGWRIGGSSESKHIVGWRENLPRVKKKTTNKQNKTKQNKLNVSLSVSIM